MIDQKTWESDFITNTDRFVIIIDNEPNITVEYIDPITFETTEKSVPAHRQSDENDHLDLLNEVRDTIFPYVKGFMSGPVDLIDDDTILTAKSRVAKSIDEIANEFATSSTDIYLYKINKRSMFDATGKLVTAFLVRYDEQ